MKVLVNSLLLLFALLSCAKPKENVFEDTTLAQEEEVRFCLVGDLGKDTPLQQEIADALGRENCHRIFFLGDLVYPKGIDSVDDPELEKRFLNYYLPLLEENPNLIINLVLGNHDHKKDPSAWKDVHKRYDRFFFPDYYYMIDYGGLCMVALDTSFLYYTSKVPEATRQTKWLTQLQTRLKECGLKVAFTHHPLKGAYFSDWEGAEGLLKAFLEGYVIGRFDMLIAGHVHTLADDGEDEGTKLLISGTGGEVTGGGKPGFIVLSWDPKTPKSLSYSFRRIDPEVTIVNEEEQEEYPEAPVLIHRSYVEPPWYKDVMNFFKDLF